MMGLSASATSRPYFHQWNEKEGSMCSVYIYSLSVMKSPWPLLILLVFICCHLKAYLTQTWNWIWSVSTVGWKQTAAQG